MAFATLPRWPIPLAMMGRSLLDRERLEHPLSIESASHMDEGFITPEVIREIDACDVSFAEYNTVRALRLENGQFEKKRFGGAWAMRDRTRDSAYYNAVYLDDYMMSRVRSGPGPA